MTQKIVRPIYSSRLNREFSGFLAGKVVSFDTLLDSLEEDESRAILWPLRVANNDMNLWIVEGKNKLTCGGEPSSIVGGRIRKRSARMCDSVVVCILC